MISANWEKHCGAYLYIYTLPFDNLVFMEIEMDTLYDSSNNGLYECHIYTDIEDKESFWYSEKFGFKTLESAKKWCCKTLNNKLKKYKEYVENLDFVE